MTVTAGDVGGDDEASLIAALEDELVERYRGTPGEAYADVDPTYREHFREPHGAFFIARENDRAVGCGGIRWVDDATAEIKRMYVRPESRKTGVARKVLASLEAWAAEHGFERIILESGTAQPDACALYESSGYERIEPYGVWKDSPESICYSKRVPAT